MNLKNAYLRVINDPLFGFFKMPDGQIIGIDEDNAFCNGSNLHVFPGSYCPIHYGHKTIYQNIPKNKTFELSIERVDKLSLLFEDLEDRLKQFVWYAPVLVLNHSKFIQKAGVLRKYNPIFHVGYDTAIRVLELNHITEVQGMRCDFYVYPRKWNGKICTLKDIKIKPANFIESDFYDEKILDISSSSIRSERSEQ